MIKMREIGRENQKNERELSEYRRCTTKKFSLTKKALLFNIIVLVESSFILSRTHARAHAYINRRNDDDE
tara:strand:+ start:73 stop:282 length:210 start_codon:yes stop_codon:yes gene_type:complete